MTDSTHALADDLQAILRSVPGVTAIYPAASLPRVVVDSVLAAAAAVPVGAADLISVSTDEEGTSVTALIGVTDSVPAHQTGRTVHAEITDYLGRTNRRGHDVTVRIGTVG